MSDHIGPELDPTELAALRAALIDRRSGRAGATGDLGGALMYAFVMWHRRIGALAFVAG